MQDSKQAAPSVTDRLAEARQTMSDIKTKLSDFTGDEINIVTRLKHASTNRIEARTNDLLRSTDLTAKAFERTEKAEKIIEAELDRHRGDKKALRHSERLLQADIQRLEEERAEVNLSKIREKLVPRFEDVESSLQQQLAKVHAYHAVRYGKSIPDVVMKNLIESLTTGGDNRAQYWRMVQQERDELLDELEID